MRICRLRSAFVVRAVCPTECYSLAPKGHSYQDRRQLAVGTCRKASIDHQRKYFWKRTNVRGQKLTWKALKTILFKLRDTALIIDLLLNPVQSHLSDQPLTLIVYPLRRAILIHAEAANTLSLISSRIYHHARFTASHPSL